MAGDHDWDHLMRQPMDAPIQARKLRDEQAHKEAVARIQRMGECYDAMTGIANPAALAEVLAAAREVAGEVDGLGLFRALRAALAKLDTQEIRS